MMINGVFIIPTGLKCALGGDASFLAGVKLISSCVNELVVNPNAVNASDINEIPENALYVEGSTIDRFLEGKLNLRKVKTYNKILMVVNSISPAEVNAMNAAKWTLGADIKLCGLDTPLIMKASINDDGTAGGFYSGVDELVEQVSSYDFDVLAIQSEIQCDLEVEMNYWKYGGVNPWGGIEAIVSRIIAEKINKPIAHGPSGTYGDEVPTNYFEKIFVKKSMAAEIISSTFIFCVLKGLHTAPRLEFDLRKSHQNILSNDDIDFLLTPHGCWGRPHVACMEKKIPIIVVRENTTCFSKDFNYSKMNDFDYSKMSNIYFVQNYLEAAGLIIAMNSRLDYRNVLLNG